MAEPITVSQEALEKFQAKVLTARRYVWMTFLMVAIIGTFLISRHRYAPEATAVTALEAALLLYVFLPLMDWRFKKDLLDLFSQAH